MTVVYKKKVDSSLQVCVWAHHTTLSTIYNNSSHNYWVVDYYKFAYEQITIYYLQFATYELGIDIILHIQFLVQNVFFLKGVTWSSTKLDT